MLQGLLSYDVKDRLGCGKGKWEDVKQHPFLEGTGK